MRVDFPNVNRVRKRLADGTVRLYHYHRPTGTRLPDDPASPAFAQALAALESPPVPLEGTVHAWVTRFLANPDFLGLAPKTRAKYRANLEWVRETIGDLPIAAVTRKVVRELRDGLGAQPNRANDMLAIVRRWLFFVVDEGGLPANPAVKPRRLKWKATPHRAWCDDDHRAFRAANETADPMMVLAHALGLFSGQREADLIALAWTRYDGERLRLVQAKTGAEVDIPVHPELKGLLDAARARPAGTTVLTDKRGRPFRIDHFRHRWRRAVVRAGLQGDAKAEDPADRQGLTFHGLRHTTARLIADAGFDVADIMAVLGHATIDMAVHYSRQSARRRRTAAVLTLPGRGGPKGK